MPEPVNINGLTDADLDRLVSENWQGEVRPLAGMTLQGAPAGGPEPLAATPFDVDLAALPDPEQTLGPAPRPLRGPAAPRAEDPLAAAMRQFAGQRDADLARALRIAAQVDPEAHLEAGRLGAELGLPAELVGRNPEQARALARERQGRSLGAETPELAEWLRDLDNARLAHDDLENLGHLERLAGLFKGGYYSQQAGGALAGAARRLNAAGPARGPSQRPLWPDQNPIAGARNPVSMTDVRRYNPARAVKLEAQADDLLREAGHYLSEAAKLPESAALKRVTEADGWIDAAGAILRDPVEVTADAIASSGYPLLKQLLAGTAGAVVAGPPGALAAGTATSFDTNYRAGLISALTDAGVDLADPGAVAAALANPAVAGPAQAQAFRYAGPIALLDGASMGLAGLRLAGNAWANAGLQTAAQGVFGGAGEAAGSWNATGEINPGEVLIEGLAELPGGVIEPLIMQTRGALQKSRDAAQAVAYQNRLGEVVATAQASKLAGRDPAKLAAYAARLFGPAVETVNLPADTAVSFFQSHPEALEALETHAPAAARSLREAALTGADMQIGAGDYIAHLGAWHDSLGEQVRLGEAPMSGAQAAAWQVEVMEELERMEAGEASLSEPAEADPLAAVAEGLTGQLVGAGFAPDVAETTIAPLLAMYRVMGARTGIDPAELAARYPVSFGRDLPEVLTRSGRELDDLDPVLDRLRAGEIPSQEDAFGKSLVEFLREAGGLVEDGGELAARDLALERGRGQRSLVQASGMTLDHAAELAVEAGYLTARDPDQLLAAIDAELAGTPQYATGAENLATLDLREALLAMGDYLEQLGVDVQGADNATLKRILREGRASAQGQRTGADVALYGQDGRLDTDSEAFAEWFGDSVVVDADGAPRVVYHGGPAGIEQFRIPAFFTGERDGAEWFAENRSDDGEGEVAEVYLAIARPLGLDTREGSREFIEIARAAGIEVLVDGDPVKPVPETGTWGFDVPTAVAEHSPYDGTNLVDLVYVPAVREALEAAGYDGLALQDMMMNDFIETFVALRPEQVKSVSNRGSFDPADPNILHQDLRDGDRDARLGVDASQIDQEALDALAQDQVPITELHRGADQRLAESPAEPGGAGDNRADQPPGAAEPAPPTAGIELAELDEAAVLGDPALAGPLWAALGTDSPFFRRWFGDSKLVDAAGRPVIFYHGTEASFEAFDTGRAGEASGFPASGLGIFLSADRALASAHGGQALAAYVSLERPYLLPAHESTEFETVAQARAFAAELAAQGYDGIYIPESRTAIAFASEQVKLTDNRGTFDPTDPRILYQFAGENAATADPHALTAARERVARGHAPEQVRRDTGWHRGVDGRWRFEISDDQAAWVWADAGPAVTPAQLEAELGDQITVGRDPENPKLYKASYGTGADYLGTWGADAAQARANMLDRLAKARSPVLAQAPETVGEAFSTLRLALDRTLKLGDVLDHPLLFAAYPDLANIGLSDYPMTDGARAGYRPGWPGLIHLHSALAPEEALSSLLHEVQHAIQHLEGFATGGNANADFAAAVKDALDQLTATTAAEVDTWLTDNATTVAAAEQASALAQNALIYDSAQRLLNYARRDKPSGVLRLIRGEFQWLFDERFRGDEAAAELQRRWYALPKRHRMAERNAFLRELAWDAGQFLLDSLPPAQRAQFQADPRTLRGMLAALQREASKKRAALVPLQDLRRRARNAATVTEATRHVGPFTVYQRLAGEVEARNTQARQTLDPDQRTATAPAQTADVDAEQAIVIFGGLEIDAPMAAANLPTGPGTPAFARWFGESKVVDASGAPLVVYHGTTRDFSAFDSSQAGSTDHGWYGTGAGYFTALPESASSYSVYRDMDSGLGYGPIADGSPNAGANVVPVYLSIQNPYIWGETDRAMMTREGADELTRTLKEQGYDGVIVPNPQAREEGDVRAQFFEVIPFYPEQIKSAVGNSGTFDPADPSILAQSAYHGSPHRFDKFSLEAIGTGEGAQAYGWGLYFAGRREVAEFYREILSGPQTTHGFTDPALMASDAVHKADGDRDYAIRRLEANARVDGAIAREAAQYLRDGGEVLDIERPGALYQVDIPEDAALLDWDAPLAEQPEAVKAILRTALVRRDPDGDGYVAEFGNIRGHGDTAAEAFATLEDFGATGATYYRALQAREGSDQAASQFLNRLGIPGLRYLDGASRGAGAGSRNYVIWDEAAVTVEAVNDELRQAETALDQQVKTAKRGYIRFGSPREGAPRPFEIRLLDKADLSTVLHESGHYFLEVLGDLATAPDAPVQVAADYRAVLDWFGVESRAQITTEQHEQFARGFEAYLYEGRAPSAGLRQVFARFRAWLIAVYRSLRGLNVQLTDEVRGVFDRLLATDEEIAAARAEAGVEPLFASAEAAGMDEVTWAAYRAAVEETALAAEETLTRQVLAETRREAEAWWREAKAAVRAEVTAEVNAEPLYIALSVLRWGRYPDGSPLPEGVSPVRLARAPLVERYGRAFTQTRLRGLYRNQGGVGPEVAAELFGFPDADALVNALADARPKAELIAAETEVRMRERHGDLLTDGQLPEAAAAAVHNEQRAALLVAEVRALSRQARRDRPAPPWTLIRTQAEAAVARQAVRALDPGRYLRAERAASRQAFEALAAGDHAAALTAKQRELFNLALYRAARDAKEAAAAGRKYLLKFTRPKVRAKLGKAGADYLAQIDALLARVELAPVSGKQLDRRASLLEWYEAERAGGREPVLDPAVLRRLEAAGTVNFRQLTVEEARGLVDTVKNIEHLARLKTKLLAGRAQAEYEDARAELIAAVEDNNTARPDLPVDPATLSWLEGAADKVRAFDASLLRMEQVIDWLDGSDVAGPWRRYLWQPAADAQAAEADLNARITAEVIGLFESMPRARRLALLDKFPIQSMGGVQLTRQGIIALALNLGTESNHTKLRQGGFVQGGRRVEYTPAMLSEALSHLDADDLALVQGIWDLLEGLWPEIAALEKRATGLEPERLARREVPTPQGITLRGGYYPMVYDANHSRQGLVQQEGPLFEEGYERATTPRGHTKARIEGFARPVLLDLAVLPAHLGKVVHDLTHREFIIDAHRLLSDEQILATVQGRLGEQVKRQLYPWLKRIANDRAVSANDGLDPWMRFLRGTRLNATIVAMGYKVTTMTSQLAGFTQSVDLVGKGPLVRALGEFMAGPFELHAYVTAKSGEMRHRMSTLDRDIRDNMRRLIGRDDPIANVRRFAFHGIGLFDMAVTLPTWKAAYDSAIAAGETEAVAIGAGDRAVRLSQGAGGAKDLAAVQGNHEAMKLLTMFYSYFSTLYNRLRDLGRTTRSVRDLPRALARSWWLVVAPAILGEILTGRGPDEDEDKAKWVARTVAIYPFLSIPLVRDVLGSAESGYGYQFTPAGQAFETATRLATEFGQAAAGEPDWAALARQSFRASGYVFGLPTGQLDKTGRWLWGLVEGEIDPEDPFGMGPAGHLYGAGFGPPRDK